MLEQNWLAIPMAGLIPLIVGYIWYHPSVWGTRLARMNGEGLSTEWSIGKIVLILLFSMILAYVLTLMSVHQSAMYQLFFMDPDLANASSEYSLFINEFMSKYGDRHRSFGHGLIHGSEAGIFFGLSFLGIPALLQGKPLRQIWIHFGFLVLCCSLMAGTTCALF